ncbi:tRNA uridine 5-carboxymethylaminomethyl modification enzyme MnmG [Bacteroidaceae bacterium]|uniref:tRNA uridine-5-carboxymethylaminomethyl(34) synthesis enzyme MnmG n=1 Tax=Prevotella sp. MGM2 TaxID=2033406 RepID=UPI000CE9F05D|nr:tRNA uridine-5-carboxymethylaminomethyl(34) synthesis enzyme MnmG [Prevotella sp. MGM2]GAY31410.1 tRNA uridine 5-carboxymethylaminomethyl modification enzyme GidA [Prevotella sp. MGM2]GFI34392.1 tRNA uridine 5-carboxymethylaminomethyl modification enzyme MnmG [Bacteroidaceae bacterium]
MDTEFHFDVVVVGAGHAGCEAAAAAARTGAKTCLITIDMNKIAQMSCNPAIGGIAKGQIVREIDALGGQTGEVTDATAIQFRMLNRSKGPAMWSPRAQCDRTRFIKEWRHRLENTENLSIWQDEVTEIIVEKDTISGVRTLWGAIFHARAVVITAGTFLNGLMHVGQKQVPGGRCAEPAATLLTESIANYGIRYARMKTGTPVRIDARSVHFEDMDLQSGETDYHRFSYISPTRPLPQLPCWTCNTNKEVHEILQQGLPYSPLYNGQIKSIGPRYCPSIETKLITFPEREQHPLFLEPEGLDTNELYLNGFSSSLPMNIQIEALKKIPCFRDIIIYRPGYAIEYDFFDPTQLKHTLESKKIDGLYFAGQVNGTTGYEEAAGQGIVAGINAAMKCGGNSSFILHRDEAYIGVLIDDLVTKGVDEPYRMFTSRAEYRILLRQDNADIRLTPYAEKFGTATKERTIRFNNKKENIGKIIDFCKNFSVKYDQINPFLEKAGSAPLRGGCKIIDIINRPEISFSALSEEVNALKCLFDGIETDKEETIEAAEIEIKYNGYISRERALAEKMQRLESIKIKGRFNYEELTQLSTEARQKLSAIDPETLAQAGRIPGVSPSDISVLLILLGR